MKLNFKLDFNLTNCIITVILGLLTGLILFNSVSCARESMALLSDSPIVEFNFLNNNNSNGNLFDRLKNNVGGEVPLPEGNLNFFYNNEFRPDCCLKPQQYSSSTGCACISVDQMHHLNQRGGNNNGQQF